MTAISSAREYLRLRKELSRAETPSEAEKLRDRIAALGLTVEKIDAIELEARRSKK